MRWKSDRRRGRFKFRGIRMRARVKHITFPKDGRILAVSDIHGNLPYLEGLLDRVGFCDSDTLLILGDMVEKGEESLSTLRFIMGLCRGGNVHVLRGNCDGWHRLIDIRDPVAERHTKSYVLGHENGLIAQMCAQAGFPVGPDVDMDEMREALRDRFAPEFDFLRNLPIIIETENYSFVHGGLPEGDLDSLDAIACMKNDRFMHQGRRMDKWCVVGHWPVVLYCGDIVCANPIIDRFSKIISIDGGCALKDDGQLNALVIPHDGSEDFDFEYYDHFPVRRVQSAQRGSDSSAYIRYGDNLVRVLERGEEFSVCRHERTGYRMEILTKYLYGDGDECLCNDCTDYELPLSAGDAVSVVEDTSRGYLVKRRGVSGWYRGKLADGS